MKFESTRNKKSQLSFEEVLFTGYAADGGLYIPTSIPRVPSETLKQWALASLSYVDIVKKMCRLFSTEDDIPDEDLNEIIEGAFKCFPIPEIIRVKHLSNGINIAELFHGRTLAFKDLALSVIGKFLDYFLEKRRHHLIILITTTGDTGSAAIESVRGSKWVDIIVMMPKDYCTWIQEHQMTTTLDENVHVYRVGEATVCYGIDEAFRSVFNDKTFSTMHNLSSINSINWFRVMLQMANYYYIYLQLCPDCDQEVEFVIPSGACGNLTAACTAYKTGLPVKIVAAITENDIIARIVDSGDFSARDVVQSLASAMCEKAPYNLERILHLFSDGDTELVKSVMEQFARTGAVTIPEDFRQKLARVVQGSVTSDAAIKETMRRCYEETGYLICPHTATAVNHCFKHKDSKSNEEPPSLQVCIATASPAKFPGAVTAAGLTPQAHPIIDSLRNKPTRFTDIKREENIEEILREKIVAISELKKIVL